MDGLNCINPDEIKEGDLVAYIHGDTSAQVAEHVAHCHFCAAQVEELRMVDVRLAELFYREHCPTAETLAAFVLDRLPPTEKLKVAAHLRTCPVCADEIAAVDGNQDSEPPSLLEWLRQKLDQATKARQQVRFAPSPLRSMDHRKCRFESDDLVVTLAVYGNRLTGRVRRRPDLLPVSEAGTVWLLGRSEGRPRRGTIDEQGRFQFEALLPDSYTLLLEIAGRDVTLEKEVRVG